MLNRNLFATILFVATFIFSGPRQAQAYTLESATDVSGKFLLTGSAVNTKTSSLLKITFYGLTQGSALLLCAGTIAQFNTDKCGTELSVAVGSGPALLTLVDTATLNGKQIYVLLNAGSNPASFSVTIE
jgi:hypothetical protein